MTSLRARLRAVLGLTLACCWIGGVGLVVTYTAHSESSRWDSRLQTFGTRLLLTIPAGKVGRGPFGPGLELPPAMQRMEEHFAFQIWRTDRKLFIKTPSAPEAPFQPTFVDGFTSRVVAGRKWRIYTISDRYHQVSVQVANLQSVADREMQYEALVALAMLTAVLLVVAALLGRVLDRSLRPLADIESALRRRRDFDLAPLPLRDLPLELHPLVRSFNHVLQQLDAAIGTERRFIGDAVHELRTPLAALQAQADVALHAATPADKDAALHTLQAVARRSARLAEQLLDVARLDAGAAVDRGKPLDLAVLAMHVAREQQFHASRRGCTIDLDTAAAPIAGDMDEVATLLRNLVDNAVRFAGAGGRVLVRCGTAADHVYLSVADDGPGVPAAEQEAIFQRFYRRAGTDGANDGRGSGIGLSLVAAIARLHGARIVTGTGLAGRGFAVSVAFPPCPAQNA
ncbi:signal transduction histidine kinase [Pseudoduganella flava]|uniref:histidine kinase n=1 Tax=Pseudoduganella flava TaxID=871742 RepID=A0A562PMU5_9BURK|nr:ATP-binding protein [Pseudoduganella flava]QGZ40944.1 HAMP domain-containing protein [Pseudoduganella flava]TWI45376.1 signal transduction histidine kinase [Pseudoduganella flava]